MTCGQDKDTLHPHTNSNTATREDATGYVVLVRTDKSADDEERAEPVTWSGREVNIPLTGDTAISVSHMEV